MPTEPQYKIKCGHCDQVFLSDTLLHIELCRPCFLMGHRGNTGGCWRCKRLRDEEALARVQMEAHNQHHE